jgi:ATP-dependent helicase STH1/SNF2
LLYLSQAKARVHRLGQKKQTLVLRLVTPNTVEEKVNNRAQARLQNEDLAIEAGKFNQVSAPCLALSRERQREMERERESGERDRER